VAVGKLVKPKRMMFILKIMSLSTPNPVSTPAAIYTSAPPPAISPNMIPTHTPNPNTIPCPVPSFT
jgi:hypothetical protein